MKLKSKIKNIPLHNVNSIEFTARVEPSNFHNIKEDYIAEEW